MFFRNLSSMTQNLLATGRLEPRMIAKPWIVFSLGWIMLLTSIVGIVVNARVFFSYIQRNMTSFYIMCSSKTVSNLIIISVYLLYNAPITILNNFDGPTFLNMLVNQMVSYGVYLLGPVTQFLVSVNRLLVMFFVKQSATQNHQNVTLVVLAAFWIISIVITAFGVTDECSVVYIPELLNWWSGGCDDVIAEAVMAFVTLCGITSNVCNLLVLLKIAGSTLQNKRIMDSESSRHRKRRSRNLFIQNCIQDWIFVVDSVNVTFIRRLSSNVLFHFVFSIFSNLISHVLDGCIMLFFHLDSKPTTSTVLTVKKSTTTGSRSIASKY